MVQRTEFISVQRGKVLQLKLVENRSTGYTWQLQVSPGINIISDHYEQNTSRLGAPGLRIWELRISGRGVQIIKALNKRPWEPTRGDEDTYEYIIHVLQ